MIYRDFLELLRVFAKHRVQYTIIGGYAVGLHGEPRYTKDLDILISSTTTNAKAVLRALTEFGAPIDNLTVSDLATPGLLYIFGIPPLRVDILNHIERVDVAALIRRSERARFRNTAVRFIALGDLIRIKKIAGRKQDLADVEKLEQLRKTRKKARRKGWIRG